MTSAQSSESTIEPCGQHELSASAVAARRRRFLRALGDLGLDRICGPDWIGYSEGSFTFGDLSDRAADALLRRLEEFAGNGTWSPSQKRVVVSVLDECTGVTAPVQPTVDSQSAHIQLPA